ncbi:MAG: hypothetical protein ACK56S_02200, partial [Planctomycetota bacterium]
MLQALRDREKAGDDGGGGDFVELLQRHLGSLDYRIADRLETRRVDRYVAVGGTVESLADLVASKSPPRKADGVEAHALADLQAEV